MNTIAWKYIFYSSSFFAILFYLLNAGNHGITLLLVLGWFFTLNQINASIRWNIYIRRERNATDNL